jgi:hypothetical protein
VFAPETVKKVLIRCLSRRTGGIDLTVYDWIVSKRKEVMIILKNLKLINHESNLNVRMLYRLDVKFIHNSDVLFVFSYKRNFIKFYSFHEATAYKKRESSIRPTASSNLIKIGHPNLAIVLIIKGKQLYGVFEMRCFLKDGLRDSAVKERVRQVRPWLIIPLKTSHGIDDHLDTDEDGNLSFMDVTPVKKGRKKVEHVVERIIEYKMFD